MADSDDDTGTQYNETNYCTYSSYHSTFLKVGSRPHYAAHLLEPGIITLESDSAPTLTTRPSSRGTYNDRTQR
ncbi:hypothetical protein CEXT_186461 [Caerostris extrusa]|uniref:Uncharacterized protein n=1 Tax=Caerostris extrusa TaxID=172846 RepID=A0AAV4U0I7_CAEEX|nr:hypothetical protein CEXT_186461 [Caerostris extrusa]